MFLGRDQLGVFDLYHNFMYNKTDVNFRKKGHRHYSKEYNIRIEINFCLEKLCIATN